MNYIVYKRVSTDSQGKSRLGLEAQDHYVSTYLGMNPGEVIATFTEQESGKRHENRPQLKAALEAARREGAVLLIAKLDRLARNVAFIANLMESDVKFVVCDMPYADPFRLHIEAAVAEDERRRIALRTKEAFAASYRRNGYWPGENGRKKSAEVAVQRAQYLKPIIDELADVGITTHKEIAAELNQRGIQTPRGGRWHPTTIARTLDRLAA